MNDHDDSADPASQAISSARATEQAIQQLCRTTLTRASMAPAEVDIVLAHLADAAAALPQAASQLGDIFPQSKEDRVLEMDNLTEIEDPYVAIDTARIHLDGVRDAALDLNRSLDAAHNQTARTAVTVRRSHRPEGDMPCITSPVARPDERQPPVDGFRWYRTQLSAVGGAAQPLVSELVISVQDLRRVVWVVSSYRHRVSILNRRSDAQSGRAVRSANPVLSRSPFRSPFLDRPAPGARSGRPAEAAHRGASHHPDRRGLVTPEPVRGLYGGSLAGHAGGRGRGGEHGRGDRHLGASRGRAGAVCWAWSRKRARNNPPARTPQQVWDDTDPEYRRRGLSPPGSDGGWGSPL